VKKSPLTLDELYEKIKINLTVFELDKSLLIKCIDIMINKDYININNNKYYKLLF
jgi:hypothetical protein